MKYALGIEIGKTKLQLFVGSEALQVEERLYCPIEKEASVQAIRYQIESAVRDLQKKYRFAAVGVGFGGPVDRTRGSAVLSDDWAQFDLIDWMEDLAHCPTVLENDANTAGFAEAILGAGKGFSTVFYANLSTGVGGGLIQSGEIYHGARPGESQLGQLRLDRAGTTLESLVSGWAVDARIKKEVEQYPDSLLATLTVQKPEAKCLLPAMEQGDELAIRIVNETAETLAWGLSHAIHLFHPEIIVLGGGLALIGQPLRDAVEKAFPDFVMEAFRPLPKLVLSELKHEAIPIGALLLARHRLVTSNFE
ncbi:MAG: ROK family protein [Siphonobacter sp.]